MRTRRVFPLLAVVSLVVAARRTSPSAQGLGIYTLVSTGASHTCALSTNGRAYCWGDNSEGELGSGQRVDVSIPTPVAGHLVFLNIDAGVQFTCGASETGEAYCWGINDRGQLGVAAIRNSFTPVPVSGGLTFRSVVTGETHACGVSDDGTAWCWGANIDGQLGTGDTASSARPMPVALELHFVSLTAGDEHTCGITQDSAAYCWGNNRFGQLGTGRRGRFFTPQPVMHHRKWIMLSAGGRHVCGIAAGRRASVYCWGSNFYGQAQMPNGPNAMISDQGESRFYPVLVDDQPDIIGISAGRRHTCLAREHSPFPVTCWGTNLDDQLGQRVIGPYRQVSAGDAHTCALRADGAIYCWGRNASGQLGDGTLTSERLPVRVVEPIALAR